MSSNFTYVKKNETKNNKIYVNVKFKSIFPFRIELLSGHMLFS